MPSDAVRAGEVFAERVYAKHQRALLRYARHLVGDLQRGGDIVQEVLLRAWLHANDFHDADAAVQGWLYRVAHNVAVDELRYARARPAQPMPDPGVREAAGGQIDHLLTRVDLTRAMARLRPEQRSVLAQVFLAGRTTKETAQVLRIPHGTARSRLHYGLRRLRAVLSRGDGEH